MKHRKMVVYIGLQEFKRHLTTHKFQIGIFGIFKGHRVLQAMQRPARLPVSRPAWMTYRVGLAMARSV